MSHEIEQYVHNEDIIYIQQLAQVRRHDFVIVSREIYFFTLTFYSFFHANPSDEVSNDDLFGSQLHSSGGNSQPNLMTKSVCGVGSGHICYL